MKKLLICFALVLLASASVLTEGIKLPRSPKNLTEEVQKVTLDKFIKDGQASKRLPVGTFDIEAKDFNRVYTYAYVEKPALVQKTYGRDTYTYLLEFTLKHAATQTSYDIRLHPETDLQNTTVVNTTSTLLGVFNASAWANVKVADKSPGNHAFNYTTTIITNNVQLEAIIFANGFAQINLPNLYFKVSSQGLSRVEYEYSGVNFFFEFKLLNELTGETHAEEFRFHLIDSSAWLLQDLTYVYAYTEYKYAPVIQSQHVSFTNTSKLTYNPLSLLWNKNLKSWLQTTATKEVQNAIASQNEKLTGVVELKQDTHSYANVTDTGIEFGLQGKLLAKSKSWYKDWNVKLFVKSSNDGVSVVSTKIGEWYWVYERFGQIQKPLDTSIIKIKTY